MSKIYMLVAAIILLAAIFIGGMYAGRQGMIASLAKQEAKRQEQITQLTIEVNKARQKLKETTSKTVEIIKHVKDPSQCDSAPIPPDVVKRVR
jgi:uncharacterized membrane-anchored protein YhcB (DUF1043 family)